MTATDDSQRFLHDTWAGLAAPRKHLQPKYFYDDAGSALFEAICKTPEYYLTRAETALLRSIAPELASALPDGGVLLELGSGSSEKTHILLDAAPKLAAYVPVDVSADALAGATARLHAAYPHLAVHPVLADFTQLIRLPEAVAQRPVVAFFPGSTLGNFEGPDAQRLMHGLREQFGSGTRFIVGADQAKDEETLLAAYNDAQGVTAAFNRNLLLRINRELQGDFDAEAFEHRAIWNPQRSHIEMHLVSSKAQVVSVADRPFNFQAGETIHTENSHKFTPASFAALASASGWVIEREWISGPPAFGVYLLRAR